MLISSPVEVYRKLLLFTLALLFGALELFIPRMPLFPWLKPGFANIVTIVWLIRYGIKDAFLFGFLRIWITSFFFGFSFFALIPAVLGLVCSVSFMSLMLSINRMVPVFGFMGVGITGAFFHNMGQLVALQFLVGSASLVHLQFPVMIGAAIITGTVTGLLAYQLDRHDLGEGNIFRDSLAIHSVSFQKKVLSVLLFILMILVVFITNPSHIILFMLLAAFSSVWITKSTKNLFISIRRSWFFVLTIFFVTRWGAPDWTSAIVQMFRLWGWIFCTDLFRKCETDRLFFVIIHRLFPQFDSTIAAALLTVELFPEMMKNSVIKAAIRPVAFLKSPSAYLKSMVELSHDILEEGGWGKRFPEK